MSGNDSTRAGRRAARVHDAISFIGFACGAGALGLIVVIYAYEVTMRYFFIAPTTWASDLVTFLLLLSVFLVIPWLTKEGGHVAVTLVPDLLPRRAGTALLRLGFFAGAVACFWSGWISLQENFVLYDRGTSTLTTIRIPKWTLAVFITYGLVNSGVYFLLAAVFGPNAADDGEARHA
ncbi:TRAP transporter small permease [Tranquillimonas alkanivorans]|uniref:TRAP transporter small permease protein n=1 Tax=Tranquillimonas alkanivorans TaxID=441119 RepID=A0A1I5U6S4_9RHOB|nr:TRAP transporter small permease [Tranquillimonas alkanivorans]SFP90965.1 TRAP-type C4-dicarboxylate transport system, small permease component [Tranquillimonas alkanivorans]